MFVFRMGLDRLANIHVFPQEMLSVAIISTLRPVVAMTESCTVNTDITHYRIRFPHASYSMGKIRVGYILLRKPYWPHR